MNREKSLRRAVLAFSIAFLSTGATFLSWGMCGGGGGGGGYQLERSLTSR